LEAATTEIEEESEKRRERKKKNKTKKQRRRRRRKVGRPLSAPQFATATPPSPADTIMSLHSSQRRSVPPPLSPSFCFATSRIHCSCDEQFKKNKIKTFQKICDFPAYFSNEFYLILVCIFIL
jgi:hypothetical protein